MELCFRFLLFFDTAVLHSCHVRQKATVKWDCYNTPGIAISSRKQKLRVTYLIYHRFSTGPMEWQDFEQGATGVKSVFATGH